MKKILPILGLIGLLFISFSLGSSFSITNDETVYVLLNYDGKIQKMDLVNWIEVRGRGNFFLSKDVKYFKNIDLYTEDIKMVLSSNSLKLYGTSHDVKNIYLRGVPLKKSPLEFKITYKYNGKISNPKEFIGKKGNLDIEVDIKTIEGLPFRIVMSTEFSADDLNLKNPENFMLMILGKTVRVTGFAYPIPYGRIILSLRGNKLRIPEITFTAFPSIPPIDLSMAKNLKSFYTGLEGFLLLNQAHQKILKGILKSIEESTPSIPQEFLTLPFTLISYQNKAYYIAEGLKSHPINFNKLYIYIKERAEKKDDEEWKTALNLAEEVKKEMEEKNFSNEIQKIGDFIGDLGFQSKKAMELIGSSMEGLQKIEELLNIMLYGGELKERKIPGLVDAEKEIKKSRDILKNNIQELERGEKKIKEWEKKLKNYTFTGKIEGAKSVVRFYFKLKEMK